MVVFLMRRRPPRSTRMTRSFPTRRSADLTRAGACQTRILETTVDARLIAIDALTGRPCRDFGRDGQVSLLEGLGPVAKGYYFINGGPTIARRSEEHTSELQSLMRISYAVFCLKKKNTSIYITHINYQQLRNDSI